MDEELKSLLEKARAMGASVSQMQTLIDTYKSKKKSGGGVDVLEPPKQQSVTSAPSISPLQENKAPKEYPSLLELGRQPQNSVLQPDAIQENIPESLRQKPQQVPVAKSKGGDYAKPFFKVEPESVATKDGVSFNIGFPESLGLSKEAVEGMKSRVRSGVATPMDIQNIAKASGKPEKVVNEYVNNNEGAGDAASIEHEDAQQRDRAVLLIQKANKELGMAVDYEKTLATPQSLSQYLSEIKLKYQEKEKRETAEYDAKKTNASKDVTGYGWMGVASDIEHESARIKIRNEEALGAIAQVGNALIGQKEALRTDISGDQKINSIINLTKKREQEQAQSAIDERAGSNNLKSLFFSPLLHGLKRLGDKNDSKDDIDHLNSDKGAAEELISNAIGRKVFYNNAQKKNIIAQANAKGLPLTDAENNRIRELDVESESLRKDYKTGEQIYAQYPVQLKNRVIQEINDFNADVSGNIVGGGSDRGGVTLAQHLAANGYDLKNQVVKDALDEGNQSFWSHPLSTLFGKSQVKDYSLFGKFPKAAGGVFREAANSLAGLTGLRDDLDILADKRKDELFPSSVGKFDEKQLTETVKNVQTVAETSGQVVGQGLMQVGLMGVGRLANLSKVAATNTAFWGSGALVSYDGAKKDSYDFIDNEAGREVYAGLVTFANSITEKFFPEAKLFQVAGVKDILSQAAIKFGKGELTEQLAKQLLQDSKNKLVEGIVKYGKAYGKNVSQEVAEEGSTSAMESSLRYLFGDPNMNLKKALTDVKETAIQTAIGMSVVGGMGAYKDLSKEKNISPISTIYNAAIYKDEALDAINKGVSQGLYTAAEKDEKIQTLNTAVSSVAAMKVAEQLNNKELKRPQREVYVGNLTAEALLAKQFEALPKSDQEGEVGIAVQERITNLQSQRNQILKGEVDIDDYGNVTAVKAETAPVEVTPIEVSPVNTTKVPEATAPQAEKTETPVTESIPAEDQITVGDMLDKSGTYNGKKGLFIQDGQTVVFQEEGGKKEYELGNIDEVKGSPISDYGIANEESVVAASDNGNLVVRGAEYVNNFSDPMQAVTRNENGDVVSVSLETADGKKRTFRGNIAEDLAYQINLKEINKDNDTRAGFEDFINSDEATAQEINATGLSETSSKESTENYLKIQSATKAVKTTEDALKNVDDSQFDNLVKDAGYAYDPTENEISNTYHRLKAIPESERTRREKKLITAVESLVGDQSKTEGVEKVTQGSGKTTLETESNINDEVEVVDEVEKQYAERIHSVTQATPKLGLLGGDETSKQAKEKLAEIIAEQPHIADEESAKKIYKQHENIRRKFEKLKGLIQCR